MPEVEFSACLVLVLFCGVVLGYIIGLLSKVDKRDDPNYKPRASHHKVKI